MNDLVAAFRRGERRALARAISRVENGDEALAKALYPQTGQARVIGITGPPGAGKSTLVDRLATSYREQGRRVAIVAVDPSSPYTGGAILGDRIRMGRAVADTGVYMRSLSSRGRLGGLSAATPGVVDLLDAFGFEVILVETVGAGQSEVEIMALAHSTLVVLVPGLGDEVQAVKAGLMEVADLFVVNKADREGADRTVTEVELMLDLGDLTRLSQDHTGHHGPVKKTPSAQPRVGWRPPVLKTVARQGEGVAEVVAALERHADHLRASGQLAERGRRSVEARLRGLVTRRVLEAVAGGQGQRWAALVEEVAARRLDPYTAAEQLLQRGV